MTDTPKTETPNAEAPQKPVTSSKFSAPQNAAPKSPPSKPPQPGVPQRRQAGVPRKFGAVVAGQKNKQGSVLWIPVIFIGFMVGLVSTLAAPVIYIYEVIAYNKKNEWPGWSGLDALNRYFFSDAPLFFFNDALYDPAKVKVINFKGMPDLTSFVNEVVYLYLDCSIVFLCLLNGIILLVFSIRTAMFRLNKEGD
ncbi:MAG: hypothetical protein ACAH83_11365 [Alphaproteobacteria bacterium]